MNVYSLLESKLGELSVIRESIFKNEYEKLYGQYKDVINDLLFLETKEEFMDFINEQKEIEEESFLLALAYKNDLCCSFGMYEENKEIILKQYIRKYSQTNFEYDDINESIDLLVGFINKVNVSVEISSKKFIVLLDDTYCEGRFYIFCVTDEEKMEEWESMQIERLV